MTLTVELIDRSCDGSSTTSHYHVSNLLIILHFFLLLPLDESSARHLKNSYPGPYGSTHGSAFRNVVLQARTGEATTI